MVGLSWRRDPARRGPLLLATTALLALSGAAAAALLVVVPVAAPALVDPGSVAVGGPARVERSLAALATGLLTVLVVLAAGRVAGLVQGSADPATRWARARGLSAWQGLAAAAAETAVVVLPALVPGLVLLVLADGPGSPAGQALRAWALLLALVVAVLLARALAAAATPVPHLAERADLAETAGPPRDAVPGEGRGRDVRDVLVVVFAAVALGQLVLVAAGRWSVGLVVAVGVLLVLAAGALLGRALGAGATVLSVAVSTVVLLVSAQASLGTAVADARRLDVGASLAITTERPPGPGAVARGTAALNASDLAASPVLDSDASTGGEPAGLLALDAAAAPDVLTWRADLAPPDGADAALAALVDARPDVPLLPLPPDVRGLAVEVSLVTVGQEPADVVEEVGVEVLLLHADGTGQLVDAGEVGPDGGGTDPRGSAVPTEPLPTEPLPTAPLPTEPLPAGASVVGLDVTTRFAPGAGGQVEVVLDRLVALTGDGPVTLDPPREEWRSWASRSTASQRPGGPALEPVRVGVDAGGGPVLRLAAAPDPRTDRIGAGDPPTDPVAAVVAGLPEQDVVELQGAGPLTRVRPLGVAGWVPRAGERGALVDLHSLTLARFGAGSAPPSARSWLVAPPAGSDPPPGSAGPARPAGSVEDRAVTALVAAGLPADELSPVSAPPGPSQAVVTVAAADRSSVTDWTVLAAVAVVALVGVGVGGRRGVGSGVVPRAVVGLVVGVVVGAVVGAVVSSLLLPGLTSGVLDGAPARVVLQLLPGLPGLPVVPPVVLG